MELRVGPSYRLWGRRCSPVYVEAWRAALTSQHEVHVAVVVKVHEHRGAVGLGHAIEGIVALGPGHEERLTGEA